MRSLRTAANDRGTAGFTLIEMLIIAPIILIMVSGFIALMISMVGDVLQSRDKNVLMYDAQNALSRIEQDARLSSKFLSSTGTLTSPQGSNNNFTGTAAFSNASNTLILSEPATDEDSASPTRSLVYYAYQPNACTSTLKSFNRVFTIQVVYFINNGSLWRRTIVPDYNLNSTPDANTICDTVSSTHRPWAQNTCSIGHTATRCETNDEEILKNISSLAVKYYANPSDTSDIGAANAEQATAIEATITSTKTTAGRTFTTSDSLRATKINSLDTDVPAPDTPVITHTASQPDKIVFSWNPVSTAGSYSISYNINGGTWINSTVPNTTTSLTVDATRGDTISVKVKANGGTLSSAYGTDLATVDLWTDLSLKAGWSNYNSSTYDTAQFTKSPDGTVFLKGTVKGGTTTSGTVLATLPTGYRPAGKLVMATSTSSNTSGRVEIDTNGDIIIISADNTYLSLDSMAFLPSTSPYTWNSLSFLNGWSNYPGYEPVHATKDGVGRVHVQGLAKPGTTASNTTITQLQNIDSSYAPDKTTHFSAGSTGYSDFWIWYDGSLVKRGSQSPTSMGLQAIYYPGTLGSWTPLTLQHSWVNYGTTTYSDLQYTKASDKVVTIRGLIKNGTTTSDTVIANMPAGYRPLTRQVFSVPANDLYGRIDVGSNGDIMYRAGGNTWIAINISYIVN